MKKLIDQIKTIAGGGHVRRFHTVPTHTQQTVGHHSYGVASFLVLMGATDPRLLINALWHDVAEAEVGDIPAPAKRNIKASSTVAGDVLEDMETAFLRSMGIELPELTAEEHRKLKLADCFDGLMACIHERSMGNQHIRVIYWRFRSYIGQLNPVGIEMDIFMALSEMWREVDK